MTSNYAELRVEALRQAVLLASNGRVRVEYIAKNATEFFTFLCGGEVPSTYKREAED